MKPTVRAWPFESKYLRDFAVVEEHRTGHRLFPATEQLPLLSAAIDQEFKTGLTTRLATADGRADNLRKLHLWKAATAFCRYVNGARPDHLHVQPYYTPELVTQIAVVQQISRTTPGGLQHWFRFFRGQDFLPDVYLTNRRVIFTTHAIERFSQRALTTPATTLSRLIGDLFYSTPVLLRLERDSVALVFGVHDSIMALPIGIENNEVICLTALSTAEIGLLEIIDPPMRPHFHYGPTAPPVTKANFDLGQHTEALLELWRKKIPCGDVRDIYDEMRRFSWTRQVQVALQELELQGHTPASLFQFYDNIPGPNVLWAPPSYVAEYLAKYPSGPPKPPPSPDAG